VLALGLCKCQRGEGGPHHHCPTKAAETYDQVLEYTEKLGCSIKTFDEMCSWAHYSPGVAKGGSFTPFKIGGIDRNYSRINQKTIDKSFGSRLLWYTGGTYTPSGND